MLESSPMPDELPRDADQPSPEANVLRPDFSRESVLKGAETQQSRGDFEGVESRESAARSFKTRIQQLEWQLEALLTAPDVEETLEQELRALITARKFGFDERALEDALHAAKKKKEISELQQALDLLKNVSRQDELRKAA